MFYWFIIYKINLKEAYNSLNTKIAHDVVLYNRERNNRGSCFCVGWMKCTLVCKDSLSISDNFTVMCN